MCLLARVGWSERIGDALLHDTNQVGSLWKSFVAQQFLFPLLFCMSGKGGTKMSERPFFAFFRGERPVIGILTIQFNTMHPFWVGVPAGVNVGPL